MLETDYQRELGRLLSALPCNVQIPPSWGDFFSERGLASPTHGDRRHRLRRRLRIKAVLEVKQTLFQVERKQERHIVYSYDVSREGMAFVHAEQMYPREECLLWLPHAKVPLIVTRCQRYNSRCFVIGTRLLTPAAV